MRNRRKERMGRKKEGRQIRKNIRNEERKENRAY